MENEKKSKKSVWPVMITILLMLILGAAACAGTWYYMNQQVQTAQTEGDKKVVVIQKQYETENKKLSEDLKASESNAAKAVNTANASAAAANETDTLKTFCNGANTGATISTLVYVKNQDGTFGGCGITAGAGGSYEIAKLTNGTWTKIWQGNGTVEKALVTQYKIPTYIYPHQLLD